MAQARTGTGLAAAAVAVLLSLCMTLLLSPAAASTTGLRENWLEADGYAAPASLWRSTRHLLQVRVHIPSCPTPPLPPGAVPLGCASLELYP